MSKPLADRGYAPVQLQGYVDGNLVATLMTGCLRRQLASVLDFGGLTAKRLAWLPSDEERTWLLTRFRSR